jgi:acyl-CoA thioester hydrolase
MPRTFQHTIRVPYAHTDQMGFVYYAHYLMYFEMARAELLREVGLPYTEMEQQGVMLPVVEAHCEYKQPARFDDALVVHTHCREIRKARLHLDYEIKRDEALIVTGYTHHVCMDRNGNVMRPIPELSALIEGDTL